MSVNSCRIKDCNLDRSRSPFCKNHYTAFYRDLIKLLTGYGIPKFNDYTFSYRFKREQKESAPEKNLQIIDSLGKSGNKCIFEDCIEGGSYKNLCPGHNNELRKHYRDEECEEIKEAMERVV